MPQTATVSRNCFEIVAEFYYCGLPRTFFFRWKKERSRYYVTDDNRKKDRQDAARKESNYFKTVSQIMLIFVECLTR